MKTFIIILILFIFVSCGHKNKDYAPMHTKSDQHQIEVLEVINASDYTYLMVKELGKEYWMAIASAEVKEGDQLYFNNAVEMTDFKSKELNRVFKSILFVDQVSHQPINKPSTKLEKKAKQMPNKRMQQLLDSIQIEPVKGTLTIEELYTNPEKYNQKMVAVRGQVVKVNSNIMNRNWVHLMDGTRGVNRSDLTFTTQETFMLGDTIVLEGKLAVDKEFGAGYVYPLIVEDARLK